MKGIFAVERGKLGILDIPIPEPGPYEVLLKSVACSICNSTDTKLLHGQFFSGTFPVLLGHESVGRVVKLGEKVRTYKPGDLVLRGALTDAHVPLPGGRSCWGGFAEYNLAVDVWARDNLDYAAFAHPQQIVPDWIDPLQAAALITLKENLSVISNMDVKGKSLVIIGTGPVAQSMTLFARLLGASFIAVAGRQERWHDRFIQLGADAYFTGQNYPPAVQEILRDGGFDRAAEAVGDRNALKHAIALVGNKGKVGLYGVAPENEPYLQSDLEQPVVFSPKVAEAEVHTQILEMIRDGKINLSDWISHTLPWQDYQLGFEMVWRKEANKVVLVYG